MFKPTDILNSNQVKVHLIWSTVAIYFESERDRGSPRT